MRRRSVEALAFIVVVGSVPGFAALDEHEFAGRHVHSVVRFFDGFDSQATGSSADPSADNNAGNAAATPAAGSSAPPAPSGPSAGGTEGSGSGASPGAAPAPENKTLACIAAMPLNERVNQRLMFGVDGNNLASSAGLFRSLHLGGAILMGQIQAANVPGIKRFKESAGSIPPLISVDEEGGRVQRLASLGIIKSQAAMAATETPAQAQAIITAHGKKLKAAGVDEVLGPVADVAPPGGSPVLGDRIFSSDPTVVKQYVVAYDAGLKAAGLIPTDKHFPGLGRATGNTDDGPATVPPQSVLKGRDEIPYELADKSGVAIMVGNQGVPGLTGSTAANALPASLTPATYNLLKQMGYGSSLTITDSLDAGAINAWRNAGADKKPLAAAMVQALGAGATIALTVSTPSGSTISEVVQQADTLAAQEIASGTLSERTFNQRLAILFKAKHFDPCASR